MYPLVSLLGLVVLLVAAWLLGGRGRISWKTLISGVLLQFLLGLFILKTQVGLSIFAGARDLFVSIMATTNEGSRFVFGGLADPDSVGFSFATMVLPTIVVIGSLMAVLYHLGVIQLLVRGAAYLMVRVMGTSGAESLAAAANVFAGQTEAPLVIKPYIQSMTRSELMSLMTGGMATVSGSVLGAYVTMGVDAGHLLSASVMSAPAALVCAKLLVPETEIPVTRGTVRLELPRETSNVIDAAARGAGDGLKLALNVGAMLLAFIAIIAMLDAALGWAGGMFGYEELSLRGIFGVVFAPVAWLMGVPWADSGSVGSLLGIRLVANEIVAYQEMHEMILSGALSPRAEVISTYALCGFANFSSIAIQVGGIGSLAPGRRKEFAALGIRCLVGGTMATMMTACVAGVLI